MCKINEVNSKRRSYDSYLFCLEKIISMATDVKSIFIFKFANFTECPTLSKAETTPLS